MTERALSEAPVTFLLRRPQWGTTRSRRECIYRCSFPIERDDFREAERAVLARALEVLARLKLRFRLTNCTKGLCNCAAKTPPPICRIFTRIRISLHVTPPFVSANSHQNPLNASAFIARPKAAQLVRRSRSGDYLRAMLPPARNGANMRRRYDDGGRSQRGASG